MKINMPYKILGLTWVIAALSLGASSRSFELAGSSALSINGTSTLHDWTMSAEKIGGRGVFTVNDTGILTVSSLRVEIESESLKSGKKAMDKNAYKSLSTTEYPKITFVLNRPITVRDDGDNHQRIISVGQLEVAGVKKNIKVKSDCEIGTNEIIKCVGEYPLKMTEFKITPPTALLGVIKTGDEITVQYDFQFLVKTGFKSIERNDHENK